MYHLWAYNFPLHWENMGKLQNGVCLYSYVCLECGIYKLICREEYFSAFNIDLSIAQINGLEKIIG